MFKKYINKATLVCVALVGIYTNTYASNNNWSDISSTSASKMLSPSKVYPEKFRTLELNYEAMKGKLLAAPLAESIYSLKSSSTEIEIPMPYGSFERFNIVETPMMESGLAAKYANIKTFTGTGVENPSNIVKIDIGPYGFHAMVLSEDGRYFIDPVSNYTTTTYISYYRKDLPSWANTFNCSTVSDEKFQEETRARLDAYYQRGGSAVVQLRTYRLALACTVEYSSAATGSGNPTKEQVLAKMVTSMNRVNGVYETDVAVHMNLVDNNDTLIFLPGSSDPYSNNDGGAMLSQNQNTVNARIGSANYDIGHVFSTGGGGIAGLGVVCTSSKAEGVTGSPSPVGDGFDIDYVAHEMGHQFAGNHTFNSVTGACGGGNRSGATAYEPGSGTTIMAYAGICGADDLAAHSDPYFHAISLDEINAFINSGQGNNCPVKTVTTNNPPVVNAGANYTIPISTPFTLVGSATDPDGDELKYSWEQMDLGPGGAPNTTTGNSPLFRFFPPTSQPVRTFPKLNDILTNTQIKGERLPNYGRSMKFRLTARDNKAMAGATGKDEMTITVSAAAGPFNISSFNVIDTVYIGSTETITWNVANTNTAPVNCSYVRILLSTDGGLTFPIVISDSTENDGSEAVVIPNNITNTARIKIQALGNIFFDISNAALRVLTPTSPDFTASAVNTVPSGVCPPDTAYFDLSFNSILGFTDPIIPSATNVPAGASVSFSKASVLPGETIIAKVTTAGLTLGSKNITFVGTSGVKVRSVSSSFTVLAPVTIAVGFTSPANGQINVNPNTPFTWNTATNATGYKIEIATDSNFNAIVLDTIILGNTSSSFAPKAIPFSTQLFARIYGTNNCGDGPALKFVGFTTGSLPSAPTNLTKLSQTASSATLKWTDNATNENGYRVERKVGTDTTFTEVASSLGANTTVFIATNLVDGTTYAYRVRAVNAFGYSSYSNTLEFAFTVGINQNKEFTSIDIFPNPSSNVFNVQIKDEYTGETTLQVVDELGRILMNNSIMKTNEELNYQFDLSSYANGIYFIKILSSEKTTTKRVVKMN